MEKSRKKIAGLSGLIVLGMVAAFLIGVSVQTAVFATPIAQNQTKTMAQEVEKSKVNPLTNLVVSKFASRLGLTEAQLDAALLGAVEDTAAQALKDGLATQDEVTVARKVAQSGSKAFVEQGFSMSTGKGTQKVIGDMDGVDPKGALIAGAARALGLTEEGLVAELSGNKSLSDLATAHGVSIQTLKDTMLAEVKTAFDAAVKTTKITQAKADELYAEFSSNIGRIIGLVPDSK
jgi:hypothetical protein